MPPYNRRLAPVSYLSVDGNDLLHYTHHCRHCADHGNLTNFYAVNRRSSAMNRHPSRFVLLFFVLLSRRG